MPALPTPSSRLLPIAAVAALVLLVAPAGAQMAVERDPGRILTFPVEGVALGTPPVEARAILEGRGFVEVSWFGTPGDPAGWNYERGWVRVTLRQEEGVLTAVERTEEGWADRDVVDVEGPARHVRTFFGLAPDECVTVDAAVSCTVADESRDPSVVVTAQLVPHRTILKATRLETTGPSRP